MSILFINQLIVSAVIGVYDWEQSTEQELIIDIEMSYDIQQSAITDNVSHCLNYVDVINEVVNYIKGKRFFLIERLAVEIANLLMINFNIPGIRIKIGKPGAVTQASMVGVIVEKGNI